MSEDLTNKLPKGDDNVARILQNIDSRLQSLEQKVEERLHDTRPIWQKVGADIAQLQEGQRQLQEGQRQLVETIASGFGAVIKSIRDIYYKMDVLNQTMLSIQANHRDVDSRVRDLEAQQNKPTNSST